VFAVVFEIRALLDMRFSIPQIAAGLRLCRDAVQACLA
jgi:hypothetical protein